MPNHVYNEITLHGVSLARAVPHVLNDESVVSFHRLLPLPINFWAGSVGSKHEAAFPGNWLDAASKQWGTKWDAYGSPTVEELDGNTIITFQTAWSMPRGWVCALFNTLKCDITAKWLDEGRSDAFREKFTQDSSIFGDQWTTETIPADGPEHRRLHLGLWGVERFGEE